MSIRKGSMAEYREMVKALRYCGTHFVCTEDCPRYHPTNEFVDDCRQRIIRDSAEAIEELQQIAGHYEQTANDYWKEACEYKAQLLNRGKDGGLNHG